MFIAIEIQTKKNRRIKVQTRMVKHKKKHRSAF